MGESNDSMMAMLRSATWDLHQTTEGHGFQQSLSGGSLPREQYIRFLGQMLLVHTALERHLRDAAAQSPFCDIVNDRLYRAPLLQSDLEHFGVDGKCVDAEPATTKLVADIDRLGGERSVALLGMLYVLEGSTNGGKWIAKAARKAYGLESATGAAYFDPYGDEQRANWQLFKDDMNKLELTDAQRTTMADAAREMFVSISRISDNLVSAAASDATCTGGSETNAPSCPMASDRN